MARKLSLPRRAYRACRSQSEIETPPRHPAGVVSRQASPANVRPDGVNRARRRDAHLSHKGGAAIAAASHASQVAIDIDAGDSIEIAVALH